MKKLTLVIFSMLCINWYVKAQVPEGFNYQAVIKDNSGELLLNGSVSVRVSIIDDNASGILLYREIHSTSTNKNGLINLKIGSQTSDYGIFAVIDWSEGAKYMKVEIDDGDGYDDLGTFQLLSVPYALYAKSASKAEVLGQSNVYSTQSDTLFVVKDHEGNVVFAVFPDGAQLILDQESKGRVGGFAVSGRSPAKDIINDYFIVTPDSTRIYVTDTSLAKGRVGGFAVSGRSPAKGTINDYLQVTKDSTRIYINQSTKGRVGGFAVSGRSPAKDQINNFIDLTPENYFIGHEAGSSISGGLYNTFIGYQSGKSTIDGYNNLFLGYQTGYLNESGYDNVFIGNNTGYSRLSGYDNIFIGNLAGENSSSGTHSVYIGNEAGHNMNGDDNVSIGDRAGSNAYVSEYETYGTTILGVDAGRNIQGHYNTIVGTGAGSSWSGESTGDYNVFIGTSVVII